MVIKSGKKIDLKFNWPVIDKETEEAVVKQLYNTISIYDHSGIIKEFEDAFKTYIGRKYGLLTNAGTTALYSMFVAVGLKEGDEIICPAYTFFASISPIFFTGAVPVLCDAGQDGNIDPAKIELLISHKTKAILVTHMWGIPCEMDLISEICKKYNLILLEDCSHAHGAKYKGKHVGTFGDMAAWSLQGNKLVTGGEGGILLTNNEVYYYKALLLGHYNKRCKQEIPEGHYLSQYSITGMGLKLRAHPLAVAIALVGLKKLEERLVQKRKFAKMFHDAFSDLPGLKIQSIPDYIEPSWYNYLIMYDQRELNNMPLEKVVKYLHDKGFVEVDIPKSTSPLNLLPLFQNPEYVFPNYKGKLKYQKGDFPVAENFYNSVIKLPVWVNADDKKVVKAYIDAICNFMHNIQNKTYV